MTPMQAAESARLDDRDFEVIGDSRLPVVVALGGISASAHVAAHAGDPRPGWWPGVAGSGGALDPDHCCLVGVNYTIAPNGPTTTHDQARVVAEVLDRIGVHQARAVVGASYGGMVALAFGELFPRRAAQLVVLCAAHESDPMSTALRVIQRRILRLGLVAGRATEALQLARALAIVTYRSALEFAERFPPAGMPGDRLSRFPVEGYLDHHAARFACHFSVGRYLALSESIDLHHVDPARIAVPVTLVGCRSDTVVPVRQLRELARRLAGPVALHLLDGPTGHDAFLTEQEAVGRILTDTLTLEPSHAA